MAPGVGEKGRGGLPRAQNPVSPNDSWKHRRLTGPARSQHHRGQICLVTARASEGVAGAPSTADQERDNYPSFFPPSSLQFT